MPTTTEYGRWAAARPSDTSETELYQAGTGVEIIGMVTVCNQDSTDLTYRLALTDASGAASGEDWIDYDLELPANLTTYRRVNMAAGQTIRIQSGKADKMSFVLMGLKKTTT